jgi:hypothetical protein
LKSWDTDGRYRKIRDELFRRSFPVIYNSKIPEECAILVFKSDFEEYGLNHPDSLNWIEESLNK